ncbi:4-alpha-glucanotransferase [Palleronia rufa]|uniref:4-alpha-glucanotransferase n=1 Tax=Palleronia rufa TaxID=1530186 RepID=UPI0005616F54|nr:4-alpha-glucanotransferase [Palleronia rufa]
MSDARDRLAERLGVVPSYEDATGRRHELTPESRDALLRAMDAPDDAAGAAAMLARLDAGPDLPDWAVVEAGAPIRLDALAGRDWRLAQEDGTASEGRGAALGALPLGIHALEADGARVWLISAPARLAEPPRAWGVTLPLYGLSGDGRIGTYRDLARACRSLGAAGADFVGVNPVHAGFPTDPGAFSPYSPAHRGRLAGIHVAPDSEPPLPGEELLDWSVAQPARLAALRADPEPAGFDDWAAAQDAGLWRFALHQALSERFGPYWPAWPPEYHDPDGDAAQAFARREAAAVRFHATLQYRADAQLADAQTEALAAGMRFGLYLDLAVGTHPEGAETWGQPGLFAQGVSLGAPPDAFSPGGQSWGLAPLRPDALARDGFRPLARILRRSLAHAKLLRIDHILGFERAFWVPQGDVPGAYVRMPRDAMLAVARIEAARAGATIVGEDLGNIPEGLGAALDESGVLGCRVVQFEQHWDADRATFRAAADYARGALTSFGSHDLPTWEGWKAGRDIDWRAALDGWSEAAEASARARRAEEVGFLCEMLGGDGIDALHAFLAATPSRLVVCQLEDLEGRVEQPNLPGTVHDHPNWRRRIDTPAGALGQLDAVARTAIIMRDADR